MNDSHKVYELTFEVRPSYFYARVQGETIDQRTAIDYLHEVVNKCKKFGHARLLLVRDIPATLSEDEVYFSGTDFAHTGLEDMQIALVDERPENVEALELTILVQNNRGANIQLFEDVKAAEEWLLKDLPHLARLVKA